MGPILGMILASMAKNELIDKPAQTQNNKIAAIQSMYAPLTGQNPNKSIGGAPSSLGSALEGGLAGWQMKQNMERDAFNKKLQEAMLQNLLTSGNRGGIPNNISNKSFYDSVA